MSEQKEIKEGWTWLHNSKKWHYFREGRSLCGKFLLFSHPNYEQGNDNSSDNCSLCKKKILKEKEGDKNGQE